MKVRVTFYKSPSKDISSPLSAVEGYATGAEKHPTLSGEYMLRVRIEKRRPSDWPVELTVSSSEVLVPRGQLWNLYWASHPAGWFDTRYSTRALLGRTIIQQWCEQWFPQGSNPEIVDWGKPVTDENKSVFSVYAQTQIEGLFARGRRFSAKISYDIYFDNLTLLSLECEESKHGNQA